MAKIIDRESQTAEATASQTKGSAAQLTKFTISVQAVFKKSVGDPGASLIAIQRRTPIVLLVPTKDLECRCLRIKTNK